MQLFCGDCLEVMKSDAFHTLIEGRRAVIVTDPPFNIGYHYNEYKDRMKEADYYKWLAEIFADFPLVCVHYPESLYKVAAAIGRTPERVASWVYNSNTAKQHRDIAYFGIKPDFRLVTQPYKNPNDKRIKERIARGIGGARLYDWWNVNQVKNVSKEKTAHPCQMPAEIMEKVIGILPELAELIIIDPFMGSGTTGEACMKRGVDFIGIEIDKQYFEIAEKRLNND